MTKYSLPLIILLVLFLELILGVGSAQQHPPHKQRRFHMKVLVYVGVDGPAQVLLLASPGRGKGPVILDGVTPENVIEKVLPAIELMRGDRQFDQLRL